MAKTVTKLGVGGVDFVELVGFFTEESTKLGDPNPPLLVRGASVHLRTAHQLHQDVQAQDLSESQD